MMKIKKIGVLSFGKILGFIFTFLGFVLGLTVTLLSVMGVSLGSEDSVQTVSSIGYAAVIILPVLYGVMGFIAGVVFAGLFNLAAGWVGGIVVEVSNIN